MPRKVFVANEILTAADVNTFLGDQAVMVFDDAAARTTAIPTPSEGMVTYLKDTDALEKYTTDWVPVNTFGIIQVVSTSKTDPFSTASGSFTDITGLSVYITPTSATSKILVLASVSGDMSGTNGGAIRMMRDSTPIAVGGAAGARFQTTTGIAKIPVNSMNSSHVTFLDSPATTSALAYKMQALTPSGTLFVNRAADDSDSAGRQRAFSSITVMEVSV